MSPEARPKDNSRTPGLETTTTRLLSRLRRRVLLRQTLRAAAAALLAAGGLVALMVGFDLMVPLSVTARSLLRWLPLLVLCAVPASVLMARARATPARLALLADERGGRGNVTSTLGHTNADGPVATAFRRRAQGAVRAIDPRTVVPLDAARLWGACLAVALLALPLSLALGGVDAPADRWLRLVDA